QCIILGVDGQTIGGYPKNPHGISAGLDKVGQLRPGQRLRFLLVTLAEAEIAYREQQAELHEWVTRLQVMGGRQLSCSAVACKLFWNAKPSTVFTEPTRNAEKSPDRPRDSGQHRRAIPASSARRRL